MNQIKNIGSFQTGRSKSFPFIWHAFWLSLAETFTDKNSVLPGLILLAGGTQNDIGYLTAIMLGVPFISQILFTTLLINKPYKKKYLLGGIFLRVSAFWGVALTISFLDSFSPSAFIIIILLWMALFSVSGAFAGISYNDLLGKILDHSERKKFFVIKQIINGTGIFFSAFLLKELLTGMPYPANYKYAFLLAGFLLLTGTLGYFRIKEKPTLTGNKAYSFFSMLKEIPHLLRENPNLRNLIAAVNIMSLSVTITPFYAAFAKENSLFSAEFITTILIYQITGMIVSNFLWQRIITKIAYKGMLRISALLYVFIPIGALILIKFNSVAVFALLFFIVGSAISAYKIAAEGALIEISNETNRVLFTGIFGSLNLLTLIFPLISSSIISLFSYQFVFIILPVITLSAFYFISKMVCGVDRAAGE